jgi:dihydroflavonol-4-reductase
VDQTICQLQLLCIQYIRADCGKIRPNSPKFGSLSKTGLQQVLEKFNNQLVLVTGATGFTGQVLCRKLVNAGAVVRAVARDSSNISVLEDLNIQWFRGDIFDESLLAEAARGANYIFHVAAAFNEEKGSLEDYRKVHVHSTQILARLVTGQPEFKRFLHVSTVGVHGHIEVDRADENYRFSPGDDYQLSKLEAEQWLVEYANKNDLPYAIIRPSAIYGPGDKRLLKLFKMAQKGFVLMLGSGKGMYHLIHVDDLTNIFLLAATRDEARGEIFIGASDEPISIIDMGKKIGHFIGTHPRTIRLPIWPFYLAADISIAIFPKLGMNPPIYRRRVGFYAKDRQFDNSKVREVLGYQPKYDMDTGLEETARWYQQQGLL